MSERPVDIPLAVPCVEGNARDYLEECLRTNFVSSVGPFVERFEREFASYVGSRFAVACSTGTAALHVAMRLAGVNPGDEVFVPTLTFIASANPVVYERAIPVLFDSESETWNGDQDLVVEEIERRAKRGSKQPTAIEVVHLLGHPAKIDAIAEACERHGIFLIEDAAEALGARYRGGRFAGRHVGTIGKVGCYSFNGNKIVTTGGGGMITTDDEALARRAKHLTTQARLPGAAYRHDEVGYNYRLTNLAAALGVSQMELLPEFLRRKRAIAARYDAALPKRAGLTLPPDAPWAERNAWLYTILVEPEIVGVDRDEMMNRLERAGAQSRPIWSPLHNMPMYRDAPRLGGSVAERIFSRALSIPCSSQLKPEEQQRVIDTLIES